MVEELSQASKRCLRTITPVILVQTGSSSIVGVVALGNSQRRQSARLALQAGVLLAHQIRTGWRRKRSDEVDAFRCR